MGIIDLREDWADLLERRRSLAPSLVPYGPLIEAWAGWEPSRSPPTWDAEDCVARWRRGVPVLPGSGVALEPDDVEDVMAAAMETLTAAHPEEAAGMRRLADAWDARELLPAAFLPGQGAVGAEAAAQLQLRPAVVAFLAYGGLRPALQAALAPAHALAVEGTWTLGVCPFCGAPPGFADIVEDGRRHLTCHLCGGTWIFSRVRCPLCGADAPRDLVRLEPEGAEEAYFVSGCTRCKGYVKEIDRRQRWNARAAVVEDWGSPHLDVVARRAGYWRPIPTLVDVVGIR